MMTEDQVVHPAETEEITLPPLQETVMISMTDPGMVDVLGEGNLQEETLVLIGSQHLGERTEENLTETTDMTTICPKVCSPNRMYVHI